MNDKISRNATSKLFLTHDSIEEETSRHLYNEINMISLTMSGSDERRAIKSRLWSIGEDFKSFEICNFIEDMFEL